MSFLRKWGGSGAGPNAGEAAAEASLEWHNETPGERYFGMENFGNTCYANSVLQSLYFSKPFRELIEATLSPSPDPTPASPAPSFQPPTTPSSRPSFIRTKSAGNGIPQAGTTTSNNLLKRAPSKSGTTAGRATLANAFGGGPKRQDSAPVPIQTASDAASSTDGSPAKSLVGAPLAPTVTNSSFTGVGTPVVSNGVLATTAAKQATLLSTLRDLFTAISSQPRTLGTVAPQAFINQLKRENEFFRSTLHQDAHEFLNYLINMIAEVVEKDQDERFGKGNGPDGVIAAGDPKTWVHKLFEGILTNETRCLACETVTSRDEAFLDLSIDIEANSSVTACLRQFSASEMLCHKNKFECDKCRGLQDAERRMKIKKLPNVLALHLKRFKYEERLQRHVKLTYRVVFPFELRLFNTSDGATNSDRLYKLWSIIVHIGVGPHHGHYISIVKSGSRWIVFDDNTVYPIEESEIQRYFGDTPGQGSGYVLFYQAVDLDLRDFGINETTRPRQRTETSSSAGTSVVSGSVPEEPAPPVPPLPMGSGLGLELGASTSVPPAAANIPLPMSPPAQPESGFDFAPPLTPFVSPTSPTTPLPAPPATASSSTAASSLPPTTPKSEAAGFAPVDLPKENNEQEGGRTLLGKMSWGRSLSLGKSDKGGNRVVSSPTMPTAEPVPLVPTSISNGHLSNGNSDLPPPPAVLPGEDHRGSYDSANSSPSPANHPPPPSDDGSVSTMSSSQNLAPGHTPQRRGSKASMDANALPEALTTTRNLFGRKSSSRPLSMSGPPPVGAKAAAGDANGNGGTAQGEEGAAIASAPTLSKKEAEKLAKEQRKAREKAEEQRAKERQKQQKEDAKRAKEAAELEKKAEKLRRKQSVR
ncbi:hypothetical protein MNV49_002897 [Pseudohyphozyma bogoriensis]|nr:hypothetical protein MNV49_002897 [Pseudohyphozyma bogoriensis]